MLPRTIESEDDERLFFKVTAPFLLGVCAGSTKEVADGKMSLVGRASKSMARDFPTEDGGLECAASGTKEAVAVNPPSASTTGSVLWSANQAVMVEVPLVNTKEVLLAAATQDVSVEPPFVNTTGVSLAAATQDVTIEPPCVNTTEVLLVAAGLAVSVESPRTSTAAEDGELGIRIDPFISSPSEASRMVFVACQIGDMAVGTAKVSMF
jgi:hypothetical protein